MAQKPTPFQESTAIWASQKLNSRVGPVKRFLVADEVGLGKTTVAREVITRVQDQGKPVIYVASSLDICAQNRTKLGLDVGDDKKKVDRICLFWSNIKRGKLPSLICLTPGTSLDIGRGRGNMNERAYMAAILYKVKRLRKKKLIQVFHEPASKQTFAKKFEETLENLRGKRLALPKHRVTVRILKGWEADILWIRNNSKRHDLTKKEKKEKNARCVSRMRESMARCIVENLDPCLVILDEFQNYRELLEMKNGELVRPIPKGLLKPSVKTLLLSATPFPAFVSAGDNADPGEHKEKLMGILEFLSGSEKTAMSIGDDLVKYGRKITQIDRTKVAELVKLKLNIEKRMKEYIARTERILFEGKASYTERLMQNSESIVPRMEWLDQWFSLKHEVNSPRTYLSLWRSGQAPLSYMMSKYKVLEGVNAQKGPQSRALYTTLKNPFPNPKLQYLWEELLDRGSSWPYLWLPPTRPYYPAKGIYKEETLRKNKVRKGLVFSAWNFVPTMIAAELSSEISKGHPLGPKHPIKEGLGPWARFWHPSPYLCQVIKHDFFASRQGLSFDELHRSAIEEIKRDLDARNWVNGGKAPTNWQALVLLDFEGLDKKIDKDLLSVITGTKSRFSLRESKNIPIVVSQNLGEYKGPAIKAYSQDLLNFLAKTALLSPSVCLLRALISAETVEAAPSNEEKMMLMDFCGRHWKAFFNRDGIAAVIQSVKGEKNYLDRLEAYLQDGNIQAMLDEYAHHAAEPRNSGDKNESLSRFLKKLALALGSRKSSLTVKQGRRQRTRVATDRIKAFGQDEDQNDSRESLREAFNSPFWPFVLATTSVGQEGLDFHLYCKEIYHWNLPSNPIQFEQREGRINRYSALWVREAVSKALPHHWDRDHWRGLFIKAKELGDRSVRHGVGISPRWSYTKTEKGPDVENVGYVRHVLAIPGSEESLRYRQMLSSLEQYRLTLGQSNQEQFLKRLKELNLKEMGYDAKGLMICLFPGESGVHRARLFKDLKKNDDFESLCFDAKEHLNSIQGIAQRKLQPLVNRAIQKIRTGGNKEKGDCAKALLYFIDPFDKIQDFTPGKGWDDDIEILKKALRAKSRMAME